MENNRNNPSAGRLFSWFNPAGRQAGGWAFALNRITALGLTFYLFLHLIILGRLAQGPDAYGKFLELTENPLIKLGEFLVIAAAILHGLNGIRIILTTFGIGITRQKQLLFGVLVLAAISILFFFVKIYLG
ncbi:MAG TPA: succinate dehydrogenase, cytochrome b556 subunit [Anaerolineales bacterium]